MPGYSFAFGPNNSYFLATPLQWTSSGLPQQLRTDLYADVEASEHFVGLGTDGEYFFARHNRRRGNTWDALRGRVGENLIEWFNKRSAAGDGKIQFVYGSDNTWIACTSNGACMWSGELPENVAQAIRGFHPVKAAMGVNDAYVLVSGDGRFKWNLRGKYATLDRILRNSTLAIDMVALNPYAEGQFIIMFKNGTYRASMPVAHSNTISTALNQAVEHQGQLNLMVSKAMLEQSKQVNNFLSHLMFY